jgi:hypothetical protein
MTRCSQSSLHWYLQQLSKLNTPTIHLPNNATFTPVDSSRNLSVILELRSDNITLFGR